MLKILFWLCALLVFYTYLGYGILLYGLVWVKKKLLHAKAIPDLSEMPEVTLLIAAYNEEDCVEEKICNCQLLNYPKGKLSICWVTDGSDDRTNKILSNHPEMQVLFQPHRQGKTAALNRGMEWVKTPFVVFTDANTRLNPNAILEIVKPFANPKVGCVAGEKRIEQPKTGNAAVSEGIYWKYESSLKTLDYMLHSAVGAAGELFAIRTTLFETMPSDTLLDDFILSMRIAQKGYKIAYCKEAYALEEPSSNILEEEKRKVRISAGGLQSIYRLRALLNPFKYGTLCFQYISHRVLRWSVTPIALFLLLPLNVILLMTLKEGLAGYIVLLSLQILFYSFGIIGSMYARKNIKKKALYIPFYFLFMNVNVIKGFFYLKKKKGSGIWEKAKRTQNIPYE